ncbi:BTAD domain-containing putative transcriptional regulator [Nonomuraea sp. NPDC049646]|uniref:BTAD domain-containing putative transcriptional regulator n=1 Tax=unclassified Nonomuraea TaxID=2593643 RepID=UPI00379AC795
MSRTSRHEETADGERCGGLGQHGPDGGTGEEGVRFRVLGPFEIVGARGPISLGGPRQRALLARLVAAAGTVVSTDTLIEDLYRGRPPATAVGSVHVYVSNLRRVLEPSRAPRTPPRLLVARRPGYLLATADVDALRFGRLVADAEPRPPAEALPLLEEALGLWRGVPYGEFADELWAAAEVNRLNELRMNAIESRARALLDAGRPQPVIHELESETAEHPLRERLWWLRALALYRSGRQADALATLRRARQVIADQLGLDPGHELRELEKDILRQARSITPPPEPAGEDPPPRPGQARRAVRGRLIGRERGLAELAALPGATHHNGVVVAAVSGEPGIGKTRLLQAFRDDCADLGHLVLWGRCRGGEGVPPLWPWLQVLRALAAAVPPAQRQALGGLLDDDWPTGAPASPHRNRAVARWLAEAARARPLVIVLDDLHWADSATLELLRDVAVLSEAYPGERPLLLVTAFRDAAHDDRTATPAAPFNLSVNEVLYQLARYDLVRIRLSGLDADDVATLAREMGVPVDGSTAELLTRRTGGNPFFVRESVRLMAQGQGLEVVPDAVSDLIRRRLAVLGPRATEILQLAALIGRSFDPGLVVEVFRACASWPEQTYELLDWAAQAGLVTSGDGVMTFVHDLVRETLIAGVPPLRRGVIHREVMRALSARPSTDVTVIAHHAVQAGPLAYRETAHWARAAAGQASRRMAHEEAAAWWGRAVAAHGACDGDPAQHVELLLHQVRALLDAGDAMGARALRAQALRVAQRAEADPALTTRALTALDAPAIWTLRNPYEPVELRLVEQFEATLSALPETDSVERTLLLGGLAQELYNGSDDDLRCLSLSAEAVAMARRIADPHLLMRALNARALSVPQATHVAELMEIAEELHGLAARTRTPGFELLAHMMDTHYRLEMHDLAGADLAAARCEALLDDLQLPWPRFQHTMWRANRLTLAGRFAAADALYGEAERQAKRIGMWYAGAVAVNGRLMLYYQRGAMAEAGPLIDLISGIHPTVEHDARVLELCAQGRRSQAVALAGQGWPAPPMDWSWLTMTCLQGAAQAAAGDVAACWTTYEKLLPYAGRISGGSAVACIGPVDHFLAVLESALDAGTDAAGA